ncbi:PWI domain-containing protein [Hesseltinella vesiculosa]|uniref:PWI domain-containing protein n=1 Tax=Hesseltinella vesiculosa TaxID=101127 RepID=A0A1X2GTV2_9FUNG|nr:PWI domain-containing protein [Hesseltinella vesiculosa]
MGDGFFKGASAEQDSRFSNKEKKLLKSINFPPEFDQKVDFKKVNLDVIRPWIANKITQYLGVEDEVIVDFAFSLLEEQKPDPKRIQINLTGFLESNTPAFMLELWKLLLSAQETIGGIPKEFIDQKKEELRRKREQEEDRRKERDSTMDRIRQQRDDDREYHASQPSSRRSRFDRSSPPPRRRHRSPSPVDRHRRYSPSSDRRSRRPSRSPSRSRSPSHRRRQHRSRSPSPRRSRQDYGRYERRR